ncbi:MAG: glycosyltransferase [Lachnospiraceae bacterium]|nr:glycosyltransferase [Lachnospiraceae bacterium]
MDRIAVLIPCYNEEKSIGKVVGDFKKALPEAVIYVYDNNSSDRTAECAQAAGAVVRREYLQGKGNVMRRMFYEIDAECYLITDGDDTYPAEYAREMADRVLCHNADMVIGDRLSSTYFAENKRPFHNIGNAMVRFLINSLFHGEIKDILTGYRAFSYRFIKTYPVLSRGFEIETEMSIHAIDKNMQVENVVVEYRDRKAGSESKLNTYSDGFKVLGTILRLYKNYHPFGFFGFISLALLLLALGFSLPVFIDYVRTGLVHRLPTLIVCGFVALSGIITFISGIILSSLRQQEKQAFERDLIRTVCPKDRA